jgi:hypothetical protein
MLYPPPEPESFAVATQVNMTDMDAYYLAWMEACFACGASGEPGKMLFCMDCGEAYHGHCVQVPVANMDQYARVSWRCVNCKLCEICGDAQPNEASNLLQCELCDKGHHMACLDPPLHQVRKPAKYSEREGTSSLLLTQLTTPLMQAPVDAWYCGGCLKACQLCGRKSSQKQWSCHQSVCYNCGGYAEKNAEARLRCGMCWRPWAETGWQGMVQCEKCTLLIHPECDPKAAAKSKAVAEQQGEGGKQAAEGGGYVCKSCLKRDAEEQKILDLHAKRRAALQKAHQLLKGCEVGGEE